MVEIPQYVCTATTEVVNSAIKCTTMQVLADYKFLVGKL